MKSPRFLAALAMAAVLTTGTTAHAAFQQVGGTPVNGQTPMQQTEVKDTSNNPLTQALTSEGDISVNGEFKKTVNNFPTPTQDGHYLRVTMPIKMDFTYDVDTHTMTSAEGVITNNSVYATNTQNIAQGQQPTLEYKKIKMTLVDFKDNSTGTTTMTSPVEFVDTVNGNTNKDKVLLPFELKIESSTGVVNDYSIKNIKANNGNNGIGAIEIAPNSTLKLKIDKIKGQNIGNENLITNQTSLTSHSLKLKFEYDGN